MRGRLFALAMTGALFATSSLGACSGDDADTTAGASDGGIDRRAPDPSDAPDAREGEASADAADDAEDASVDACAGCASGVCSDGGCDPLVFVSSKDYSGAIGDGGVMAADRECAALATAAGLSGTYQAWLSAVGSAPPATRFAMKSGRPYRLRDGRQVAVGFGALSSTLETAISVTEKGDDIGFSLVWTATDPDGGPTASATDCDGWTSDDAGTGGTGESDDIVAEWTIYMNLACSTRARLYCFEQRP